MDLKKLSRRKVIQPPSWLPDNTHYLCVMGSVAYGVSTDTSDMDIYGWCIPPKSYIFPHTAGYIGGFDEIPKFDQWQQHGAVDSDARRVAGSI